MRRLVAAGLVTMMLTIVLGGCGFFTKTGLETGDRDQALQPQSVSQVGKTVDDKFAEVARRVPAFGGMFFEFAGREYTGVLYVYLLDPAQKEAAKKAIMTVFGPIHPDLLPPREIQVLQAQYSFLQLKEWFDLIGILHNMPEVTMTDIDEAKNRLTVGVREINTETVTLIERELTKLDIPREAVLLEETGPFIEDKGSLMQALDENRNNFLDDSEILRALDLWIRQEPVPSTGGLMISDAKLLELLQLWIERLPLFSRGLPVCTPPLYDAYSRILASRAVTTSSSIIEPSRRDGLKQPLAIELPQRLRIEIVAHRLSFKAHAHQLVFIIEDLALRDYPEANRWGRLVQNDNIETLNVQYTHEICAQLQAPAKTLRRRERRAKEYSNVEVAQGASSPRRLRAEKISKLHPISAKARLKFLRQFVNHLWDSLRKKLPYTDALARLFEGLPRDRSRTLGPFVQDLANF